MGYYVEFVEPVLEYLAQVEGLNDDDRAAIVDAVVEELGREADRFHALRPLAHESMCFLYDYAHATPQKIFSFDFVVDAHYSSMGVLRIAYAECTARDLP